MATSKRRHEGPPPTPERAARSALQRSVEQRQALQARNQELEAELARTRLENERARIRDNVEWIALTRGHIAGLGDNDQRLKVMVGKVLRQFDAHVASGKPAGRFDVYRVCDETRAEVMGTLGPPSQSSALDAQLPPPRADAGALPPTSASDRDEQTTSIAEARARSEARARQHAEETRRSREAYEAARKKYGLADPALGQADNGGGNGWIPPRR
jgi:hypothetical protein